MAGRPKNVSGGCAVCIVEGTRPIIAEIQSLSSRRIPFPAAHATGFSQPPLPAACRAGKAADCGFPAPTSTSTSSEDGLTSLPPYRRAGAHFGVRTCRLTTSDSGGRLGRRRDTQFRCWRRARAKPSGWVYQNPRAGARQQLERLNPIDYAGACKECI